MDIKEHNSSSWRPEHSPLLFAVQGTWGILFEIHTRLLLVGVCRLWDHQLQPPFGSYGCQYQVWHWVTANGSSNAGLMPFWFLFNISLLICFSILGTNAVCIQPTHLSSYFFIFSSSFYSYFDSTVNYDQSIEPGNIMIRVVGHSM